MTAAQVAHLYHLADELDCYLHLDYDADINDSAASPDNCRSQNGYQPRSSNPRWVHLGCRDANEVTYYAGLHELGHVALQHVWWTPLNVVEHESQAWAWALDAVIGPVTPLMCLTVEDFLGSYTRAYGKSEPAAKLEAALGIRLP